VAKQNILIALLTLLGSLVVGYLIYQNRSLQNQIHVLSERSAPTKDGRPAVDPFIAGPVKNRILKGYGELSHCYKEYLATNPVKKSGNVRIDWQITTSGKPVSPEVVITDFANKPFEACITQKIAAWSFPEPVVKKYVEHTFKFDEKTGK